MKIYAISEIHIDHKENMKWMLNLSKNDYKNDVLILAGDVSDKTEHLELAFKTLSSCFRHICFVPGNHDIWVRRNKENDSIQYFYKI